MDNGVFFYEKGIKQNRQYNMENGYWTMDNILCAVHKWCHNIPIFKNYC